MQTSYTTYQWGVESSVVKITITSIFTSICPEPVVGMVPWQLY